MLIVVFGVRFQQQQQRKNDVLIYCNNYCYWIHIKNNEKNHKKPLILNENKKQDLNTCSIVALEWMGWQ